MVVGELDLGILQRHRNAALDRKTETCMCIDNGTIVQKGDKKEAKAARECIVRTVFASSSDMPGSRLFFHFG